MNQEKKIEASKKYGADQIVILEGLAPVRKRPAMYIGTTGLDGLHHLIKEVAANSIDEANAGYADFITLKLLPDNQVLVQDNGRGIPVEVHKQTGVSALEVVMTKLHAGGKFNDSAYKVSGGLHGVGVSVVNALSRYLRVEVGRDGKNWLQEYKKGVPQAKVKAIGKSEHNGTTTLFDPDPEIFPDITFNADSIVAFLREQAYLVKGLKIRFEDSRIKEKISVQNFYFEGGISSFVRYLNRKDKPLQETIFYVNKEADDIAVEVAIQYTKDYQETILSFANNIFTPEGGTHVVGLRTALTRVINSFARQGKYIKEDEENLINQDVREGLTAVVSVKIKEPQFEGQTKNKLGNNEARAAVDSVFSEAWKTFLDEHPKEADAVIAKCLLSAKARQAAKDARATVLRKGVLESLSLPGKLADCSSREASESELFIVEGDSAGGSAKQGRDRQTQAILPLKGKILNVEKAGINKILANDELRSLITAMGTGVGEQFDLSKLRYHKIIIMTDGDVDGAHIKTLLLIFFYRYFPDIINNGYLYIAQAPLYKIERAKEVFYFYSDEEKDNWLKKHGLGIDKDKNSDRINIQRFKGLGEMNPEELFSTTMDAQKRVLKQAKVEEIEATNEVVEVLMGKEVEPRKKFIQTHARAVIHLDI